MKRTALALVAALAVTSAPALARDDAPPIFAKVAFKDAVDQTKGKDSVLVVKFTASWCPPCKQMDKTTWRDEKVLAWFKDNGTVIAVDVDEQKDIARQNKIRAMPTMVAFRNGVEFDRVVGYKSADEMVNWASGVKKGVKAEANAELRGAAPGGAGSAMQQRLNKARDLVMNEKHEEALKEYLWLWDNIAKQDPSLMGVRGSFMANDMKTLAAAHKPAKDAFAAVRDRAEQRLKGEDKTFEDLDDWLVLNDVVGDHARTLAWFDRVKDSGDVQPTLDRVSFRVLPLLEEKGRWQDIAYFARNPVRYLSGKYQIVAYTKGMGDEEHMAAAIEHVEADWLKSVRHAYASLLASGREADARKAADYAVKVDPRDEVREAIIEGSLMAKRPQAEHEAWLKGMADRKTLNSELRQRWTDAMAAAQR